MGIIQVEKGQLKEDLRGLNYARIIHKGWLDLIFDSFCVDLEEAEQFNYYSEEPFFIFNVAVENDEKVSMFFSKALRDKKVTRTHFCFYDEELNRYKLVPKNKKSGIIIDEVRTYANKEYYCTEPYEYLTPITNKTAFIVREVKYFVGFKCVGDYILKKEE